MKSDYELLAPVGDFKNLYSAVEAGADAVYFGIKGFNMRASAKNFNVRDLGKVRRICDCSPRKPKMYLTLNTVVYDGELDKLEKVVKAVKGKVDAIICWDMSVIELCRRYGISFHVSTQASVSNISSAKFYKNLGAKKIVLARELNLKQIEKISRIIGIECFCHGAMCVAVSGRCFMSQYIHGLSANRGECAQLCRRAWEIKDDSGNKLRLENNRVMSAKDLCTLPFIEDMKKAGIKSFKIEGRNRSPEYVYTVVSEYRKALDKKLSRVEIIEGIARLKKVYNRGFSSGFYLKMPTADDFSFSENGEQEEKKEFVGNVGRYWPKAGAASVKMNAGKLKVGDSVYLISKDAPIQRVVVKSIEFKGEDVKVAKKGQEVGVNFGVVVRRGYEVYVIKQNS
ncbi:U32 family peptidase [Candidatus Pacearchaeota archaeon]|nr:U32 family peptidase [Candidatus Pacearchaeota archaeon]